jgi:flagellar biogenesis protein FliO
MTDYSVLSSLLSAAGVFACLGLFLWLLRRYRRVWLHGAGRHDPKFDLQGELQVGIRQRVVLVKVEGRSLVLSVTPDRIGLLAEWPCKQEQQDGG